MRMSRSAARAQREARPPLFQGVLPPQPPYVNVRAARAPSRAARPQYPLALTKACCASVISGARAPRAAIQDCAASRSAPRRSSSSGRPRLSQRMASSPSRVCSRIQSRSTRSAAASTNKGRTNPCALSKRMNCNRLSFSGISRSGTGLKMTGKSRFDSSTARPTSRRSAPT